MALISVCVCTYKRPEYLKRLLMSLTEQVIADDFLFEVVVVDNDLQASAQLPAAVLVMKLRRVNGMRIFRLLMNTY